MAIDMGCWKWFDNLLKTAGIEVTDENRDEINRIIRQYIGAKASYGNCSANWREARKTLKDNEQIRQEVIRKLRLLYLKWIRYKGYSCCRIGKR